MEWPYSYVLACAYLITLTAYNKGIQIFPLQNFKRSMIFMTTCLPSDKLVQEWGCGLSREFEIPSPTYQPKESMKFVPQILCPQ